MSTNEFRVEHDSMGDVRVPAAGVLRRSDAAGRREFSDLRLAAAAGVDPCAGPGEICRRDRQSRSGQADRHGQEAARRPQQVDALLAACREVADGKFDDQFPIDVFQTGSGTSSNMNANEVISNRAIELCGGDRFAAAKADPSERPREHGAKHQRHVPHGDPRGRGGRDPSAIDARPCRGCKRCWPRKRRLGTRSSRSAARIWPTPRRCGWGRKSAAWPGKSNCRSSGRAGRRRRCYELPAGGTAVGTGINTHPEFGRRVAAALAKETGIPFVEAANHFEANAQRDGLVECHGGLRAIATTLFNVANNHSLARLGPALRVL